MELFFDTETSGLVPKGTSICNKKFPWVVQLGLILSTREIKFAELNLLIRPYDRTISQGAYGAHGISLEMCEKAGVEEDRVLELFLEIVEMADTLVCHNFWFDSQLVANMICNHHGAEEAEKILHHKHFCTMQNGTNLCKIPKPWGSPYKWPTLQELHVKLFGETFSGAHDAMNDVRATRRCYYEMTKDKDELPKQD